MNQRQVKRDVCSCIATLLDAELGNGSGWIYEDPETGDPLPEAEQERREVALREVIDEMTRRGSSGGPTPWADALAGRRE
jgi:hypothetical protein